MANAERLYVGGPGSATMVLLRYQTTPLRSFDAGVTWEEFQIVGGESVGVSISPTNGRVWYAASNSGSLYRTDDGGHSWTLKSGPPAAPYVRYYPIAISADPDVVYQSLAEPAACDMMCPIQSTKLQVSTDGGQTWRDAGPAQSFVQRAFPSSLDSQTVYALNIEGLRRSTDRGATWTKVTIPYSGPPQFVASGELVHDRVQPGVMYLRFGFVGNNDAAILASRDGGITWNSWRLPAGRLVADAAQPLRAYLFADFEGAFETRDGGVNWTQVEVAIGSSINDGVEGVVIRAGRRLAVTPYFNAVRELDLTDGALALGSDLWWNPVKNGTGLTITHRGSTQTFVAWYAYDAAGAPVWRVIPGGRWTDRTFAGDMWETTGSPYFGVAFDPSRVIPRRVGTARLQFDNENSAVFSYQLQTGEFGNDRIVRQLFGPPTTPPDVRVTYDNFGDLWWNAQESGWGIAINHQYDNIFATWFAYDDAGRPLWVVMPDAKIKLEGELAKASGDIYTTRGPSSLGAYDPAQVVPTKIGTATLTFRSLGEAVLSSTAFGRTETRTMTRQPF